MASIILFPGVRQDPVSLRLVEPLSSRMVLTAKAQRWVTAAAGALLFIGSCAVAGERMSAHPVQRPEASQVIPDPGEPSAPHLGTFQEHVRVVNQDR